MSPKPGKSRHARAKRRKLAAVRGQQAVVRSEPTAQPARPEAAVAVASRSTTAVPQRFSKAAAQITTKAPKYDYVFGDMKRIGITAGSIIIVIIILSVVLPAVMQ
ncbi:MAG: hypothetical protein HYX87_02735 [Chloroflexi bacterium]|nr:hypothetical protein [Chloroflexota bacterium]